MSDEDFVRELSPWGFLATASAMLAVILAGFVNGASASRAVGYSSFVLLLVPFAWVTIGRYARTCFLRWPKGKILRAVYVVFWMAFSAKLTLLLAPDASSNSTLVLAVATSLCVGFAAARNSPRIVDGQLPALIDPSGDPPWATHLVLVTAAALFFVV
jgi:hypothetical protein